MASAGKENEEGDERATENDIVTPEGIYTLPFWFCHQLGKLGVS